jgi:hypothetical protein
MTSEETDEAKQLEALRLRVIKVTGFVEPPAPVVHGPGMPYPRAHDVRRKIWNTFEYIRDRALGKRKATLIDSLDRVLQYYERMPGGVCTDELAGHSNDK